jgi:hypothetical protein
VQNSLRTSDEWESDWESDGNEESDFHDPSYSTTLAPIGVGAYLTEFPPLDSRSGSDVAECSQSGGGWISVVDRRKVRLFAPQPGPGLLSKPVQKTRVLFDTPGRLKIVKVAQE